jgi:GAF domain-containing protein
VRTILLDVVALHGAEFGNVQMPVEDRLLIVAQHGLTAPFLETFREVRAEDGCACGRALREGQPILVRDTETDEPYRPFRATARLAGYRSVQSTPMLSSARRFTGVISTLFAHVHEPTRIEMQTVSDYRLQQTTCFLLRAAMIFLFGRLNLVKNYIQLQPRNPTRNYPKTHSGIDHTLISTLHHARSRTHGSSQGAL